VPVRDSDLWFGAPFVISDAVRERLRRGERFELPSAQIDRERADLAAISRVQADRSPPERVPATLSSYTPPASERIRRGLASLGFNEHSANFVSGLLPWTGADMAYHGGQDIAEGLSLGNLGQAGRGLGATTLAIFGGIGARTANVRQLERAREMLAAGRSRDDIWRETGWFRGADDMWRFEIDDRGMALPTAHGTNRRGALSDLMPHSRLEDAYPGTGTMQVDIRHGGGPGAMFDPGRNRLEIVYGGGPEEARSIGLHELQHRVQSQEGFSPGASLFHFTHPASPLLQYRRSAETPFQAYRRVAGEVEARNVQRRMDMTPEERRNRPPWTTQDVPDEDQIVALGRR
jgi:hypothetical protein